MIKLLFLISTLYLFLENVATAQSKESIPGCTLDCHQTEYLAYRNCLYEKRKTLSANCTESICSDCDCYYCKENECEPFCKRCCLQNYCNDHECCETSCRAQCKSSICQSECVYTCTKYFKQKLTEDNELNDAASTDDEETVIQNNSSVTIKIPSTSTDYPISINHIDINNITIGDSLNISTTEKGNCCTIISSRQCVPYAQYPFIKCFHLRKRACGPQCKTSTIHEQSHEICYQTSSGINCKLHNIFIPQPEPTCVYQPYWPFVSCGIQREQFCGGCYAHYNSQYLQLPPPSCPFSCYDDGYGIGPYYRQGPFYRPGFAHAPSCLQLGTCNLYNPNYFDKPLPSYPYSAPISTLYKGCSYPSNSYLHELHMDPIYDNIPKEVDIIVTVSPSPNKRHAEITIQNTTLPTNNLNKTT